MNIILTGMRGSGKSYYGQKLAKILGWKFLDTDEMIEKQENSTLTELIQKHGWNHFRDLENQVCKYIAGSDEAGLDEYIISTGGGLIIDPENEQLLRQNGKIILLYRDIGKCAEFIINGHKKDKRPALTDRNIGNPDELIKELEEIWAKRSKRYRLSADLIVDVTEEKDPAIILEMLES